MKTPHTLLSIPALLATSVLCISAHAAPPTVDAGSLLRQNEQDLKAPRPAPKLQPTPAPQAPAASADEATVQVRAFKFAGNTLLSNDVLAQAVASYVGRALSVAQLKEVAQVITNVYRDAGWSVRAFLPKQEVEEGVVTLQVVEAVFGGALMAGKEPQRIEATQLVTLAEASLVKGTPLHAAQLDRTLLLLDDLPGVNVSGNLVQGQRDGETNLALVATDEALVTGNAFLDNQGARTTGADRLSVNLNINSPARMGDAVGINALKTQGIEYQRLSYSVPVGYDGSGAYNNKDVATANFVSFSGLTSSNSNYTLSLGTQAATITPAPLTVTADNASRSFGAANPTFKVTLSGYVAGETDATSGVTGTGSATNATTALTDAGTSPIIAGIGTLAATNYAFTRFVDGTLTIRPISALSNTDVATLIGAQLANLSGSQVGSFSTTQLKVFSPQQLSALSPSQVAGLTATQLLSLTPDQLAAISPAKIASMAPDQLAGLSVSQFAGLTTSQLQALSAAQIAAISTAQLGQLSSAQITALTSNAAASLSFQQIAALAPTQIVGVDAVRVASLTAAEIGSLSDAQLQALSLLQIAAIAPDHFSALSPAQIMALSITQVINLTPDQLRGFSPAQVASLSAAELAYFDARQLAAIGIVPKAEAPVAQAPVPTPAEVPSVEAPVPPAIATSNQLPLNFETPNAPVEQVAASTASEADANDARDKFQAAIPVMTAVAGANAPAAAPAAPATTLVTATAQQPAATTAQAAPAAGTAQASPSVNLTAAAPQTGVLAITILSNAEPRPTTVGVAFEQDGNAVTLRTASAPPTPPASDRFTFNDKLTSFMVSSDSGGLVEFKASLVNRRLVILAQSSAARQIARTEMNVVLAAAITSLGAENRVMLANLDGVVIDLR